ncbi:MAG TPA: acyl transferase [Parafilimonas sp.]|nr:acyl transferase [Parafilimonas sp.]
MSNSFVNKTFQKNISFTQHALNVFSYQYNNNKIYKQWCDTLKIQPSEIKSIESIPFLPISFFKTHKLICENEEYEILFESSGTTQSLKGNHYVKHLNVYIESFTKCFELFYGDIKDWCLIALLPSYLQQGNSSLVKMADVLIQQSKHTQSGFYLNDYKQLYDVLQQLENQQQKTLLISVTYALLDFAERFPMELTSTTIMETGGMKGRRKEITRHEVHVILKKQFQIQQVHSEYGMTELLSQAYAKKDGRFYCPPWMKVFVRDEEDPFKINTIDKGALNIIDLANIYSCAFIATDDAGEIFEDGSFTVLGRIDNSDIRGCSLMVV